MVSERCRNRRGVTGAATRHCARCRTQRADAARPRGDGTADEFVIGTVSGETPVETAGVSVGSSSQYMPLHASALNIFRARVIAT